MHYDQTYFSNRKYSGKKELVTRHVLEVMRWASEKTGEDLLCGCGKRALDLGCAYGFTSEVLAGLGYETFGTDISSWGTRQAKICKAAEFLVCDAQTRMPFKPSTFDLVACFDVLEHLPHPELALRSMFESCEGIIVCTTPNKTVEKCARKITRDYDETHINVKSSMEWRSYVCDNLDYGMVGVESFYDLAFRFWGKLFFKSFSIPRYGLTVRIVVKK